MKRLTMSTLLLALGLMFAGSPFTQNANAQYSPDTPEGTEKAPEETEGVKENSNAQVLAAVQTYIEENAEDGMLVIEDPQSEEELKLTLIALGENVKVQGDSYILSGDFVDTAGTTRIVDFTVVKDGEEFQVEQAALRANSFNDEKGKTDEN